MRKILALLTDLDEIALSVITLRKVCQEQNKMLLELAKGNEEIEQRVMSIGLALEFHEREQNPISYTLFGRSV